MNRTNGPALAVLGTTAALATALIAAVAIQSTTAASSPTTLPPPRIGNLNPRIAAVAPRIADLAPRVVDVAPQKPAPNTFAVSTDVLFAFDHSDLSASAQTVLGSVVQQLQSAKPGVVSINGYTDSIGDANYNLGLSQRRAAAVQAYLQSHVANAGLTYRAQGFGAANPIAPNKNPDGSDNPAGRQQNRRVVISEAPS